jgi:ferredoxin-NADP reductase
MDVTVPTIELTISSVTEETAEARSYIFDSPHPLDYKAGQFLTFLFTSKTGQEGRRSYSISSSKTAGDPLMITVKRVENGAFSREIISGMKAGDKLLTIGVAGFFILPEHIRQYNQFIFFAAGSGISPIFSLIRTLLHEDPEKHILLVYSNTTQSTTIFYRRLIDMQKRYKNFRIEFLFSRFPDLSRSRLNNEVLETILNKYNPAADSLFYICGPAAYMRMIHFKLLTLSIPQRNIRKEIFQSERIIEMPSPPDRNVHVVRLSNGRQRYEISVQFPVSILQSAKVAGIPIPYSCESGQCGTCVAICDRGKVWMAHNEVLTDDDTNAGRILTCTGFPVEGDVDLTF